MQRPPQKSFRCHLRFCPQVLDKYGDIYGRERIAELLGVDLASLDVSQQHEKKQEAPDNSVFAWYSARFPPQMSNIIHLKMDTNFFLGLPPST